MHEILFRGKRETDGKWLYGYYSDDRVHDTDFPCIFPLRTIEDDGDWSVIPETVGQYTGLRDKNGTMIFEGDIVHCESRLDSADTVVIYENGQFRIILTERYNSYQPNMGYYDINYFAKTVIGNIHDNPELLKESEKK